MNSRFWHCSHSLVIRCCLLKETEAEVTQHFHFFLCKIIFMNSFHWVKLTAYIQYMYKPDVANASDCRH